jgi:hypothetical protein
MQQVPAQKEDAMASPAAKKARPTGPLTREQADELADAIAAAAAEVARQALAAGASEEEATAAAVSFVKLAKLLVKAYFESAPHRLADCRRHVAKPVRLGNYDRPRRAVRSQRLLAGRPTRTTRTRSREQRRRATRATRATRASSSTPDGSDHPRPRERFCEGVGCDVVFEPRNPKQKYHHPACGIRTRTARSRARVPSVYARDVAVAEVRAGRLHFYDAIEILTARSAAEARAALARVGRDQWQHLVEPCGMTARYLTVDEVAELLRESTTRTSSTSG